MGKAQSHLSIGQECGFEFHGPLLPNRILNVVSQQGPKLLLSYPPARISGIHLMLLTPDSYQVVPFNVALPWLRILSADETSATSDSLSREGVFREQSVIERRYVWSKPNSGWCMIHAMASQEPKSEPMNFQLLIDSISALIHTGLPNGDLDYFNQTWLNYVGITLEHLLGWRWTAAIHPEELQGMLGKWRASLATGDPLLHESRARHPDGQIVGPGTGSTAADAVRHHDLRRPLRSCRAARKSEDVHLRIKADLCHMSPCAGFFCRHRPHGCAPVGLTPAKMLSYTSYGAAGTPVPPQFGNGWEPGASCGGKARRIEWGPIRVQCQTVEPRRSLLPVDAFGLRSIDGRPRAFNWAW